MAITIRNILAAVASALDLWRHEPDPAADAAAEMADDSLTASDREWAIAAGLMSVTGLDGMESLVTAQAAVRAALAAHQSGRVEDTLTREYWHNPPANTRLN